jgi:hypothetical protein
MSKSASEPQRPQQVTLAATDPASLLVTALNALPPSDRDRVYGWLLRREFGPPQRPGRQPAPWPRAAGLSGLEQSLEHADASGMLRSAMSSSGQQVVPVRFPAEQHAQLRDWCAGHGFSMATVIRGLVARFLEGQLPGAAPEAGAG